MAAAVRHGILVMAAAVRHDDERHGARRRRLRFGSAAPRQVSSKRSIGTLHRKRSIGNAPSETLHRKRSIGTLHRKRSIGTLHRKRSIGLFLQREAHVLARHN